MWIKKNCKKKIKTLNGGTYGSDGFWSTQRHNICNNKLPCLNVESAEDEQNFFNYRVRNKGMDFQRYDRVECKVVGTATDNIPVLQTFREIFSNFDDCIPKELRDNVLDRCA